MAIRQNFVNAPISLMILPLLNRNASENFIQCPQHPLTSMFTPKTIRTSPKGNVAMKGQAGAPLSLQQGQDLLSVHLPRQETHVLDFLTSSVSLLIFSPSYKTPPLSQSISTTQVWLIGNQFWSWIRKTVTLDYPKILVTPDPMVVAPLTP